ncbi:hypothetical protein D4R89_09525, partial [bacterium]
TVTGSLREQGYYRRQGWSLRAAEGREAIYNSCQADSVTDEMFSTPLGTIGGSWLLLRTIWADDDIVMPPPETAAPVTVVFPVPPFPVTASFIF